MDTNCFNYVSPWMRQILYSIKKDIKTDHLPGDKTFYKTHFGNRPQSQLTQEEIFSVYEKELLSGNRDLVEWAVNHWVFKHGDIYRHFSERLSRINPQFQEIDVLTDEESGQALAGACETFGAVSVYIFSCLNGVALSEASFNQLREQALRQTEIQMQADSQKEQAESMEKIIARHQAETSRLKEKYENKLAGLQKKYAVDTEALKKQIRALQQRVGN
jgi:hypothetical protein